MKREVRTFRNVEVRATDRRGPNGRPVVELRIISPGVVDDYGSVWMADTFDEAILARIAADPDDTPSLCWSHRWDDPIGHGIDYTPDSAGPRMSFQLDDFDAVPRAKQAWAQVQSRTIRDCSVGFYAIERREATTEDMQRWPGAREVITKADLDEVSLVLRGAVPGAKVLRSSGGLVDIDVVVELARRVQAGEITREEAERAVELLSDDPADLDIGAGGDSDPAGGDSESTSTADADGIDVDAELDDAIVSIGRSR